MRKKCSRGNGLTSESSGFLAKVGGASFRPGRWIETASSPLSGLRDLDMVAFIEHPNSTTINLSLLTRICSPFLCETWDSLRRYHWRVFQSHKTGGSGLVTCSQPAMHLRPRDLPQLPFSFTHHHNTHLIIKPRTFSPRLTAPLWCMGM